MKRASYREAVDWIAGNDDTEWMADPDGSISVTAALIVDLFDVPEDKFRADLERALERDKVIRRLVADGVEPK